MDVIVCGAKATRTWRESTCAVVPVLHRSLEGIRVHRSRPVWVGTRSVWIIIEDDSNNPQFHDRRVACEWNNSGICSDKFDVEQQLLQGCVQIPLVLKIVFATVFLISRQRFNKDLDILADCVHL